MVVIITMEIMPENPSVDLSSLEKSVKTQLLKITPDVRITKKPVAFGLQAVVIQFPLDESSGDTEELEKDLAQLPLIRSARVTDVRRSIG